MIQIPETLSVQGRRVLVTGAASIGRATATVLHQMGATLIVTDRSPLTDLQSILGCEAVEGDLTGDAFHPEAPCANQALPALSAPAAASDLQAIGARR